MALWDKIFSKKKDEDPRHLNPIVQKSPAPAAPARVSNARPVPKPVVQPPPPPPPKAERAREEAVPMQPERETKSRKKSDAGTKSRRPDHDTAFVKRGQARQVAGDHDGAIQDFNKAIELNPNLAQAYASRGLSKEAKGDGAGAKSDYSKSIQIEIMGEINRQMRENPDVEM